MVIILLAYPFIFLDVISTYNNRILYQGRESHK